jgi:alpha-methylacyl-CoA racemase
VTGALDGVRIVELAGIGPAPHGVQLLADLGAEVVRVDRPAAARGEDPTAAAGVGLARNRRSIAVDLKDPDGIAIVLDLLAGADVLVEGFRPGVAERLGLDPEVLVARDPRLIVARVTGFGQDGPLAPRAGHDLDYLALSGMLHAIGPADRPPPPPGALVADFGGGGTFVAIGVLAALLERARSGRGQVLDVAMIDGVASLSAFTRGLLSIGAWTTRRGANLLDGGAPFYDCYRCADGGHVAVAALEPPFYVRLLEGLGLEPAVWPQWERERWAGLADELARRFATAPRDAWAERFADVDACVVPVLDLAEAPSHPHHVARGTYLDAPGAPPAPAPRLSRTPGSVRRPAPRPGEHTDEVLAELGRAAGDVARLRERGVIA